ncbi:hypothetical protein HUT19_39150 [Streptomyces sp. NA02950]|uniref:hypothetical protein n=1 Tax=Streptomyces sp. NA02950 TaxID=2742137 RepID=UPI0015913E46|nr:hypothetical protein [Streptomyces sp. NA02950]QKV96976.1 hypothetical protein HUT19_39150 [Streptomyces sp. NA02950]
MSGNDPHIHVEVNVFHVDAAVRNLMASTFGLAGDLPRVVTTGCGVRVPYAMTSPHPESVTCLACREHARRQHLRFAEEVQRLSRMPGTNISGAEADRAAEGHRDLAKRFSGAED